MADKVKLGIIGYGHIGSQHGRAIRDGKCPQVNLTAVCDIDPARLELAKKTNGEDIQTFTDASELIHSGACEAVIIAVPHYLHPSMAIEAMETGLHVIVEKPAGVYTKQVEEMNAVAAKHPELVYCMDFNQRTNPLYKKVKDLIDSGDLGEMTRVIWIVTDWYRSQSYYDQGGWRATWDGEGGGVLLNQNPHNLDLWQWMCGIPKRVKSQVYYGKHRNIEVEDDLYALVEYENGATGCYITTVGDAPGTNRLEIDGTNGKLVVENNELTFYRLRIPEPEFNAFAYIDSRVQKLVQDNVESSDLIEQQRTVMLREQFHAMITNADAANEADTDQLENLGFPIHRAKQYYLLAYRLQEQDLANEKNPDKIYEMQWFILQNVTRENLTSRSLENLCFREGGMQLYIIWTEKEDPEMVESILWSYEYCRSFLAQHFEFRYDIAVSSGHTGLDGVYKAYREVCRVYQYQQRTQDTGTIFYSDLKVQPSDTTVRYPVEIENKLHLAVRSGDEGEACTQIQALMRENQENYLSPAGMQFLVGKIMSTIVRAGEQRSDDSELAENQNRVMEAARRGSTEAMEQALCRLAGTVCQAVRASEQEAAADEKGRLYLEMRDYIEANYSDATLNVNALSEHFDRPAPFVSRYFKEMNGTNLTQYIHKVRLEHVKEKLLQDEKLETIAVTCGFGSLRSFLRIFKQYEGVTPTQYRELHSKKEETTNENI